MSETALAFTHRFEPAKVEGLPPLLLLHGTGGDENDLVPLGQLVAPGAALLSPRGQVLEHGAPRFFRRMAEGVFDEADLRRRAADLARFVTEAQATYGIPAPVALGFSNGANIAAAMMMLHPGILCGAVLLRAMVPFRNPPEAKLDSTPVLMLSGSMDPIAPVSNSEALAKQLTAAGATVDYRRLPANHGLTQADVSLTKEWLAAL
ncbi:alpha/beta hydrolase [Acetobacteraceae bacterium H6797]|nr:alpha/beta hydrolase [Acetobacteraceae bacterium H6797]